MSRHRRDGIPACYFDTPVGRQLRARQLQAAAPMTADRMVRKLTAVLNAGNGRDDLKRALGL